MSYFDQFELRKFDNLELLASQVVEGFIIGLHKSPFHGFSVEFAEHRLYNPGENIRNIDWKIYARTDRLYSKKFEEETNLRCQIVIDASSSMQYPVIEAGQPGINKIRFSVLAAASLMNLLRKQRDAFGLSIFDETLKIHSHCKSSVTHYRLMLNYMEQLITQPPINKTTNAAQSLHQIADSIHKRSMVIIFSDMLESGTEDEIFGALQHLRHNKHEVVLFHVLDHDKEIDFAFDNKPYMFIDLETDEKIKLRPHEVKRVYTEHMAGFYERLKMKCLQYHIDFITADMKNGFSPVLQSFLVKRSKMAV
ncbi:MAG: DUF58 domain-containing protein [Saprospiraceae bacterium]|uniref:DUF58 domain-containing protein n=1 Tax=Candidatus Opimibacter skivensis TaxID=2982028 RepID=A0A9D7SXX7_9BACT|nr:DUF58 domain-containing protein [Candidatus Opimibacter skivensis]